MGTLGETFFAVVRRHESPYLAHVLRSAANFRRGTTEHKTKQTVVFPSSCGRPRLTCAVNKPEVVKSDGGATLHLLDVHYESCLLVFGGVQVYNQDSIVQSVLSSAVSTVMGSRGSLLGAGELDVSSLLSGGAHLIDTWVELEVRRNLPCSCVL